MHKKKLKELNLLDDFLFFKMLNYPEIGEEFSRELLKIIFGKNFEKLVVVPQKVYYGSDTDKHGARLDVYLEESYLDDDLLAGATFYDVEPELNDKKANIESLPKRVRFYHSIIDADSLKSGTDYTCLKRVVVVMIMPFDPFGYNRMIYTIRNSCKELPELPYDDGAKTIFLYTKGERGDASQELKELLEYMENTKWENAKNDSLKKIHSMVEIVKRDKGVTLEYMKIFEREQMLREEGREVERMNTERERQRAENERQRAENERQRAERAEAKLRELLGAEEVEF